MQVDLRFQELMRAGSRVAGPASILGTSLETVLLAVPTLATFLASSQAAVLAGERVAVHLPKAEISPPRSLFHYEPSFMAGKLRSSSIEPGNWNRCQYEFPQVLNPAKKFDFEAKGNQGPMVSPATCC